MSHWSIEDDYDQIISVLKNDFSQLNDARIFFTGGTGFIGKWMLKSLLLANQVYNFNLKADVLTRSPESFIKNFPEIATNESISLVSGDVGSFNFPEHSYTHIIHAATEASADLNRNNPIVMFDTIVEGTRRVLDLCVKNQARLLNLSSGAVYGVNPSLTENVNEACLMGPDFNDFNHTYAEAKRSAELLCAIYKRKHDLDYSTARIFALLGPGLNLDIHFAAGNFIRNAIEGKKIIVNGNGKPLRSYMYPVDFTIWLFRILTAGEPGLAYNVGSGKAISIGDLANRIATLVNDVDCEILGGLDDGWNLSRYVPDTSLARKKLKLNETVPLNDAIKRTAIFNGWENL